MINEIGVVAGDIWRYLDENGQVNLTKLVKGVAKPKDLVLMGLGWLAREDHIRIEGIKKYTVSLASR